MTQISGKQPLWPYLGDPPCDLEEQVVVFPVAKVVKERFIFTSWFQLLLGKSLNRAATFEAGGWLAFFFYYFNFFLMYIRYLSRCLFSRLKKSTSP